MDDKIAVGEKFVRVLKLCHSCNVHVEGNESLPSNYIYIFLLKKASLKNMLDDSKPAESCTIAELGGGNRSIHEVMLNLFGRTSVLLTASFSVPLLCLSVLSTVDVKSL
jgi:hypothetical protein